MVIKKKRIKHKGMFQKGHKGYWLGKKQSKEMINKRIKRGEDHYNWKGGRTLDSSGYVFIYTPNHPNPTNGNYVFEHILVMEKHLGRFIKHPEEIHHINHIRADNRIENLKLFPNKSEHMKNHIPSNKGKRKKK